MSCNALQNTWTTLLIIVVEFLATTLRVGSYVDMYRVVFLTGPPIFQYQNEKQVAANQD